MHAEVNDGSNQIRNKHVSIQSATMHAEVNDGSNQIRNKLATDPQIEL